MNSTSYLHHPNNLTSKARETATIDLQKQLILLPQIGFFNNAEYNAEYIINSIKGMIQANGIIWEDIQERKVEIIRQKGKNEKIILVQKGCFCNINVCSHRSHNSGRFILEIVGQYQPTIKEFENFPIVPSEINKIVKPVYKTKKKLYRDDSLALFPDYECMMEQSLLLDDDILFLFLTNLREHLENVQIFLGIVDMWLMESELCKEFILEQFDVDVDAELPNKMIREGTEAKEYAILLRLVKSSFSHSQLFDISKESDRDSLKKFLEFCSSCETFEVIVW